VKTAIEIGFAIGLIALLASPIAFIALGGMRAKRDNGRDILARGKAAVGTVIAVDEVTDPQGGSIWKVTIEYTVPDQPDPIRTELVAPEIAWTKTIKRIQDLSPGHKVALHYREKWPSLAVIDDLVV
jgi:hypothetical protein